VLSDEKIVKKLPISRPAEARSGRAFLVALSIAMFWPSRGLSARSIWTLVETMAFRHEDSFAPSTASANVSRDRPAADDVSVSKSLEPEAAIPVAQPTGSCHSGR
jgi:hypothetical protein